MDDKAAKEPLGAITGIMFQLLEFDWPGLDTKTFKALRVELTPTMFPERSPIDTLSLADSKSCVRTRRAL